MYAGNKVLVNTGTIGLYGIVPGTTISRLTTSVSPGDTTFKVSAHTDWAVGD